ncbi:hypothetical protein WG936_08240 [Corynebacterium sp. H127]|uniref:hypothetical protein n=1 Tax=Corynebacterium sp. H127 TaxID=3133418 RepID=UPI0030A36584
MGISPVHGGRVILVEDDTSASRWGSMVDDSKATGEIVGDEVGGIAAEAGSANDAAQQLASDLTELEKRVEVLEQSAPDLSRYVPIADFEALLARVEALESRQPSE